MSAEIIRLDDYRRGRKFKPAEKRAALEHVAALRRQLRLVVDDPPATDTKDDTA